MIILDYLIVSYHIFLISLKFFSDIVNLKNGQLIQTSKIVTNPKRINLKGLIRIPANNLNIFPHSEIESVGVPRLSGKNEIASTTHARKPLNLERKVDSPL